MQIMNICQPGSVRQRITDIMIVECHDRITDKSDSGTTTLVHNTCAALLFSQPYHEVCISLRGSRVFENTRFRGNPGITMGKIGITIGFFLHDTCAALLW